MDSLHHYQIVIVQTSELFLSCFESSIFDLLETKESLLHKYDYGHIHFHLNPFLCKEKVTFHKKTISWFVFSFVSASFLFHMKAVMAMIKCAMMPLPVPVFRAEHPFLFFLSDAIFSGRYTGHWSIHQLPNYHTWHNCLFPRWI